MLKKVLFVAIVSAAIVACGDSSTASTTASADSTSAAVADTTMKKADTAVTAPAAEPAKH